MYMRSTFEVGNRYFAWLLVVLIFIMLLYSLVSWLNWFSACRMVSGSYSWFGAQVSMQYILAQCFA